jgi:hypothetical protein
MMMISNKIMTHQLIYNQHIKFYKSTIKNPSYVKWKHTQNETVTLLLQTRESSFILSSFKLAS